MGFAPIIMEPLPFAIKHFQVLEMFTWYNYLQHNKEIFVFSILKVTLKFVSKMTT